VSGASPDASVSVTRPAPAPLSAVAVAARERHVLLLSIKASAALGILGVAWGIVSGSQMILLDGIYAIIGIATSWLLLRASALAIEGPSRRYPFGREAMTPLVIGIQGTILLATLLYAGAEAVYTIARGGSLVQAGPAVVYGVIVTVAALAVWVWLRRQATATGSDLLIAEATGWRIAGLRGVGMVVGFTILAVFVVMDLDTAAPFVDPIMVIVTCLLFVGAPIGMIRSTLLELLEASPRDEVRGPVQAAVDATAAAFELAPPPTVRMTKVGPKLYLEVEGVARPGVTIAQEHEVRLDLERRLAALPHDTWLNLELRPGPADPPDAPEGATAS
jgi:predicted Co/Zn/Cd cation transporter (cation efflux family)